MNRASIERLIEHEKANGVAARGPDSRALACAEIAHEAARIFWSALGHHEIKPWARQKDADKLASVRGALEVLQGLTPEQKHEKTCAALRAAGWTIGPALDQANKQRPDLCAYEDLPAIARAQDQLFRLVVVSMMSAFATLERGDKPKIEIVRG